MSRRPTIDKAKLRERLERMSPEQRAMFLRLATPRVVERYMAHIPHPKQQVFLSLNCKEAMFGGAAGGGKSDALLMSALQYVDVPGYSALILRRTWPDLNAPGAILDRARTWLKSTDAHEKDGGRLWLFPSGAKLSFGYLLHDKDRYKFQSAEYQFVGFDELTHFMDGQYRYMFSRIRRPDIECLSCKKSVRWYPNQGTKTGFRHSSSSNKCRDLYPDPKVLEQYPAAPDGMTIFKVPLRMRSATNPGGVGHEWVRDRFIDQRTRKQDAVFVPSKLADNPSLDRESYEENLNELGAVERDRLLDGDWDVVDEGDMFQRHWFRSVDKAPTEGTVVRFWDNASTSGGGDYTVGAKVWLTKDGRWCIEDIVRGQWSTRQKELAMLRTAEKDGRYVRIRMEQEPGSSGVDVIDHLRRKVFIGYAFDGIRSTGSKEQRAAPVSSAAEAGNLDLVKAQWNVKLMDEFTRFPNGLNDDQVDAVSGAVSFLSQARSKVIA
jgi:predicted phage terminase large subunit-like protein